MMPPRARQHLDPDHGGGERRGHRPAQQEGQGMLGGVGKQHMLQDRRDERDAAGCGDRRRAITTERGAGRKLAADGDDVGQRLVEIAHLFGLHALLSPPAKSLCSTKYTELQSKSKGPGGGTRWTTPGCLHPVTTRRIWAR